MLPIVITVLLSFVALVGIVSVFAVLLAGRTSRDYETQLAEQTDAAARSKRLAVLFEEDETERLPVPASSRTTGRLRPILMP